MPARLLNLRSLLPFPATTRKEPVGMSRCSRRKSTNLETRRPANYIRRNSRSCCAFPLRRTAAKKPSHPVSWLSGTVLKGPQSRQHRFYGCPSIGESFPLSVLSFVGPSVAACCVRCRVTYTSVKGVASRSCRQGVNPIHNHTFFPPFLPELGPQIAQTVI